MCDIYKFKPEFCWMRLMMWCREKLVIVLMPPNYICFPHEYQTVRSFIFCKIVVDFGRPNESRYNPNLIDDIGIGCKCLLHARIIDISKMNVYPFQCNISRLIYFVIDIENFIFFICASHHIYKNRIDFTASKLLLLWLYARYAETQNRQTANVKFQSPFDILRINMYRFCVWQCNF